VPYLAPGDSARRYFRHCPIDCQTVPADSFFDYSNFVCYLNRIVDTTQVHDGLGFAEMEGAYSTRANVVNFNQLVTRNTGVIKGSGKVSDILGPIGFHLRNSLDDPGTITFRWRFDPTHSEYLHPISHYGTISLLFAPAVDSAWRAGGANGSGFALADDPDDRWIRLTEPLSAVITGLPLAAGAFSPVLVRFESDTLLEGEPEPGYAFVAEQYQSQIGTPDLGLHPNALAGGVSVELHLLHEAEESEKATTRHLAADRRVTELLPPRPNPSSEAVTLTFRLAEAGEARLEVIDLQGRVVAQVFAGHAEAGEHGFRFDSGALPAGLYVCRLMAGGRAHVQRMAVVR